MTAKEAIEIGMRIAESHSEVLEAMAEGFYPDIPRDQLIKLVHGNKVWLASQIMVAMQRAETARAA